MIKCRCCGIKGYLIKDEVYKEWALVRDINKTIQTV